uniref:Uncharacterized protein n=1 Tax=Acrobeloides nanus TaxID=290746 RepID=A0A914E6M6_9BILA
MGQKQSYDVNKGDIKGADIPYTVDEGEPTPTNLKITDRPEVSEEDQSEPTQQAPQYEVLERIQPPPHLPLHEHVNINLETTAVDAN